MTKQIKRLGWGWVQSQVESMDHPYGDVIVGHPRGGLVPATLISHRFNIPMISMEEAMRHPGKIIWVDDILDSGQTYRKARERLGENASYLFLLGNARAMQDISSDHIFCTAIADPALWYVFPWENSDRAHEELADYNLSRNPASLGLPINEIFVTIQGEGAFTGTPSTFIRLQGCDVGCGWCDTKHTWAIHSDQSLSLPEFREKMTRGDVPTPQYARMTPSEIIDYLQEIKSPRHIVITGGEPAQFDLRALTHLLEKEGYRCQLETSGTYPIQVSQDTWITLSPKFNMPGGRSVLGSEIERASEIKVPVGKREHYLDHKTILDRRGIQTEIYLQPLSQSEKATEICIDLCKIYGVKLSAQTHKYLGIR